VPAVIGKYWLQSVQSLHRVVVLDLGNPSAPLEVSHVEFDSRQAPHWLSVDPLSRRVVMTNSPGQPDHRIWMLNFDPLNGRLSIDDGSETRDHSRRESLSTAQTGRTGRPAIQFRTARFS
jgi:hypothetical protein